MIVSVRDQGSGISDESMAKIFDPFFTTTKNGDGLGLGLSVCQTIVKNHGGSIKVESEPDGGAHFRFDLPQASQGESCA